MKTQLSIDDGLESVLKVILKDSKGTKEHIDSKGIKMIKGTKKIKSFYFVYF